MGAIKMNTYEEVGKAVGLDEAKQWLYVEYMKTRWADSEAEKCAVGYAKEWAERFKNNREVECSDSIGQSVLRVLFKELSDKPFQSNLEIK